jgi:HK97 family phage prohead protease
MELKRKYFAGAVVKDDTLGPRQIRLILSTPTPDRVKDVMEPSGCDLTNYQLNPIVLADHNPKTPIGNAAVEVKSDRVEAVVTFAPAGISQKADEYCGLYKAGVMNASSPGFRELEVTPLTGGGVRIKRWELLEVTCCSIPANSEAVVIGRSLKAESNWKVGASRSLPISDSDEWDGDAAAESIFEKCDFDGDDPDTTFARKGFLVYDAANPTEKGSYKLPFAKVVDGRLTAMPEGIRNAASRLPQTDIPEDVATKARAVIDHYEGEMKKDDKSAGTIRTKDQRFFKRKDLYDAALLANLLQNLVYLACGADWEREAEGDDSDLPEMLASIARDAGAALVAMTAEEVAELVERLSGLLTDEQKSYVGAGKTPATKALRLAASQVKSGRKFSAATQKSMEDACKGIKAGHDAIKALLDDTTDDPDDIDPDDPDADQIAETDTGKALPAGVLSERDREIEMLRLKGLGC